MTQRTHSAAPSRSARIAWTALLIAACKTQPQVTEVVVGVESDLGAQLAVIDVAVFDIDEDERGDTHRFALGPQLALPFSFSVVPGPDASAPFVVVATGSDADGTFLAQAKAVGEFDSRAPLVLALRAACRGVECERGQTCVVDDSDTGRCGPVPHLDSFAEPRAGEGGSPMRDAGDVAGSGGAGRSPNAGESGRASRAGSGGAPSSAGSAGSAALPDAGIDAGSLPDPPIATLGDECGRELATACPGRDSDRTLLCSGGEWIEHEPCSAEQRCDGTPGGTQGTCQPIAAACMDAAANALACDGEERVRCDADRLRTSTEDCPGNAHCSADGGEMCACDSGYEDDGSGGCRNVDECPSTGCGDHGTCIDELNGYSCNCDLGYSGATRCDPTACYVCNATYPCEQPATSDYDCHGQFASWPMPDRVNGAQTSPNYTLATDTVTDNVTHLVWQRNLPGTYAGCTGNISTQGDTCTVPEAKAYCATLTLAGLEWRLPTKIELESIIDHTRYRPAIDPTVFPNTTTAGFWTASPYVGGAAGVAWAVNFDGGNSTYAGLTTTARVRCVHDP